MADHARPGGVAPLAGQVLASPFLAALEPAPAILPAGAGGGFDLFCAWPLYFGLRSAGRQAHLANLCCSR